MKLLNYFLALVTFFLAVNSAQAEITERPRHRGPDHREVYLGQYFRDQELNLLTLFNLSPWNNRGTRVESIEVISRAGDRFSLDLIADGSYASNPSPMSNYTILYPTRTLVLGDSLRSSLSLSVRGKIYIERIGINTRVVGPPGPQPGPGPGPNPPGQNQVVLNIPVYHDYVGRGNLDVSRLANIYAYRGYRLAEVVVNGRTLNSYSADGTASLMVNDRIEGQIRFFSYEVGQSMRLSRPYIVGQNLDAVTLLIEQNSYVSTVRVYLNRF